MKRDLKFEKYLFKKYTRTAYDMAEVYFKSTAQSFGISPRCCECDWLREMFCIGLSDCIRREVAILNRKNKR